MLAKLRSSAAIGGIAAALMAGSAAFAVIGEENSSRLQLAQATPMPGQSEMMQQEQPGMMVPGMGRGMMGRGTTGQDMTGQGTMGGGWGGGKRPRMMGMRGHMMKMMFAIADQDGDGALSFEEVTSIHRRIFNAIDANRDGKVTPEEFRNFMRD